MGVITLEGTVENGRIRLHPDIRLPENAKVYVLVPDVEVAQRARVISPRLADPSQIADFQMEVVG
jgi:hypothetical protein